MAGGGGLCRLVEDWEEEQLAWRGRDGTGRDARRMTGWRAAGAGQAS